MRRYISCFESIDNNIEQCDVLLIGSGLAGLYTALSLDEGLSCVLLSKLDTDDSNSYLAQGGIAAVYDKDDSFESHFKDTLEAGAGLCNKEAVNVLVNEAPIDIKKLIDLGVHFDLDDSGDLHITREGGHSNNRVLHCGGDATGKEIVRKLTEIVLNKPNLKIQYNSFLTDIITLDGRVAGAIVYNNHGYKFCSSKNIIVCSGGIGQVYKYTTNPHGATGDGIAAAMRAGALVQDMEFVQFHPTALYNKNDSERLFLISEALRGEGAFLKNNKNERFMIGVHPMAELAPRDIVAREIHKQIEDTGDTYVYLDITHKSKEFLSQRFPTIYNQCLEQGIDISKQYIPICPVQHYFMGGIKTDLNGMSNIPGLYACGEAACTGVHGANRLASNSLLECLVFGRRCAEHINDRYSQCNELAIRTSEVEKTNKIKHMINSLCEGIHSNKFNQISNNEILNIKKDIKNVMSKYGGIVRTEEGLKRGIKLISDIQSTLDKTRVDSKEHIELCNIVMVAKAVLEAADKRKVSIGAHYIESNN